MTAPSRLIHAWTALDRPSIASLLTRGSGAPNGIRVAVSAPPEEVAKVPIIRATHLMVERAQANEGLTLTKGGALSRADVKALFDATVWPDFDAEAVLTMNKVLNENDVLPVLFTRMMVKEAGLLRTHKGRLLATKRAKQLIQPDRAPELFRVAFETVFWKTNLAYLDWMPSEHWPQTHIGVVLWCLSVVAHDWCTPEQLVATCTIPDDELFAAAHDFAGFAMVSRALRPLTWFGLMETKDLDTRRTPAWRRDRRYRKTPLFDSALSFEVEAKKVDGPLH